MSLMLEPGLVLGLLIAIGALGFFFVACLASGLARTGRSHDYAQSDAITWCEAE